MRFGKGRSMLDGKRILIVEDEAIRALDLADAAAESGAMVVGPCTRLAAALLSAEQGVDGAVLDVDLAGEAVFPLADRLALAAVPFVFQTGRADQAELVRRYAGAPVCIKPVAAEEVLEALSL